MHTRLQAAVTFVWAHYLRHGGSGQKLCKNKFATVYCRLSQSLKNVFRMVSMWPIQIKGSVSNSWETVNFFMTLWKCCTQGFLGNCQKKVNNDNLFWKANKVWNSFRSLQISAEHNHSICFFTSSLFIQTPFCQKCVVEVGSGFVFFFIYIVDHIFYVANVWIFISYCLWRRTGGAGVGGGAGVEGGRGGGGTGDGGTIGAGGVG